MKNAPAEAGRHLLMDAGRGLAILGILWINIFIQAIPNDALGIPGIWGEMKIGSIDPNIEVWRMAGIFADGVMRGILSVLFGASGLIMITKAEQAGSGIAALDPWYRRQLWLIAFGVFHAYILLWPYDILYLYGLFGLFLFPFRKLTLRPLLIIVAIMLAGSAIQGASEVSQAVNASQTVDESLTGDQIEEGRQGDPLRNRMDQGTDPVTTESTLPSSPAEPEPSGALEDNPRYQQMLENIQNEISERHEGYLANVKSNAPSALEEQTSEVIIHHILDVFSFMLLGMALYKSGFLTGRWSLRSYAIIAVAGYLTGLATGYLSNTTFEPGSGMEAFSDSLSGYLYDLRRLGFVLGHFSVLAILLAKGRLNWLVSGLIACGRFALSLYIFQTLACLFIFYDFGIGLGLFGRLEHVQAAEWALLLTILQFLAAPLWLRLFGQGPLERLLRWLAAGAVRSKTR
ncbi:MAG: DUF418 domain-containing protein [Notoacmeibacter sp.]|nr:DUF418 domain-containing protein [Notoacmeibacter sp.]MCC0033278.1 DUF418 domain-containing protein [Brucellaceae bacterium]